MVRTLLLTVLYGCLLLCIHVLALVRTQILLLCISIAMFRSTSMGWLCVWDWSGKGFAYVGHAVVGHGDGIGDVSSRRREIGSS